MNTQEMNALKAQLRAQAIAEHTGLPQYEGHWDGDEWKLVQVKRVVKNKGRVSFEKGELALARRLTEPCWVHEFPNCVMVYSPKSTMDTVLEATKVTFLE